MDDCALLERVLDATASLIAGVRTDQWTASTPCPDYDVQALVGHVNGWVQMFAAAADGKAFDGDPTSYEAGADPAADFRAAAGEIVAGWRAHGTDRQVPMMGGEQPGRMVLDMTLMEYAGHGWDLATATGQPYPLGDDDAAEVLARAEQTLPPQYRGEGMPFGDVVAVPDSAPAADRLAGFLGRHPASAAG